MHTLSKYRQIVAMSLDCIKELDRDGRILTVNDGGVVALQAPGPEALLGKEWAALLPDDAGAVVRAGIVQAYAGEASNFTVQVPTFTGVQRWWAVSIAPLLDDEGAVLSALSVSRDVTELVNTEDTLSTLNRALSVDLDALARAEAAAKSRSNALHAQLQQSRADANRSAQRAAELQGQLNAANAARQAAERIGEQAQKNQAIGQLVLGVTHDFNNMLQITINALNYLGDTGEAMSQRQKEVIGYAREATQQAAVLSRRLLGFSRMHPYSPRAGDLGTIVRDLVPLIRNAIGAGMQVSVDSTTIALPVNLDRDALHQALMNVAINARDACRGRGELAIRFGILSADEAAQLDPRATVAHPWVELRDNGAGMPPEVLERVFEPFFTTKHAGVGTGLGMAQVFGAVRRADGIVTVHSGVGRGTTVRLAFPSRPVAG